MKKVLLFLLFCMFIIIGYNSQKYQYFNRFTEEIDQIVYNDMPLAKEDYQMINNILEAIPFKQSEITALTATLASIDITTIEQETHHFYIYPDNIIKYVVNGKAYYAKNDTESLINLYDNIKTKYNDISFFNIEYTPNYIKNDNHLIIELETTKEALQLHTTKDIHNLQVYTVGTVSNTLLYEHKNLKSNANIILMTSLKNTNPNLKITFETNYQHKIEITVTYDQQYISITKKIVSLI